MLVRTGARTVLLRESGYQDWTTSVTVTGGETVQVSATLAPIATQAPTTAAVTTVATTAAPTPDHGRSDHDQVGPRGRASPSPGSPWRACWSSGSAGNPYFFSSASENRAPTPESPDGEPMSTTTSPGSSA